jgi:hypothetical protein
MSKNEIEALRISRLLTPEQRADLLVWVHLAYIAENSVRKSLGAGIIDGKLQEYSYLNILRRSKK